MVGGCAWSEELRTDDAITIDMSEVPNCDTGMYVPQLLCETCRNSIPELSIYKAKLEHMAEQDGHFRLNIVFHNSSTESGTNLP